MGETRERPLTAGEAGWHLSRYNLFAPLPQDGQGRVVVANLFANTVAVLSRLELFLLSSLDELPQGHFLLPKFAKLGFIADFDELAVIEAEERAGGPQGCVDVTICPTMACNFDCPYCFEAHDRGKMSPEVEGDVIRLAARMLDAYRGRKLNVTWLGGEPLLALDTMERLTAGLRAAAGERDAEYAARVVTNGWLLDEARAGALADMGVVACEVTVDGIGAAHDATRHLKGGGATFERIVGNLSRPLPFSVVARHTTHAGNVRESDGVRALMERIVAESGNDIYYQANVMRANDLMSGRAARLETTAAAGGEAAAAAARAYAHSTRGRRPVHCGAQAESAVAVDEAGRLYKCWEAVGKPEVSFGNARDWDPANPLATANRPELIGSFLGTLGANFDECRACAFLPVCAGGCPYERLYRERACTPAKADPQAFVLALHERFTS